MRCSMRKVLALCLLILLSLPAYAVDGSQVKYVGGTLPGVAPGAVGTLDTTQDTSLIFAHAGGKLEIPYDGIQSFEYSKEAARHLGVLPAIVVSLFRMRQHRHFFRISYHDSSRSETGSQAVIFEVPKHTPRTLQAVLTVRSPQALKVCGCRQD